SKCPAFFYIENEFPLRAVSDFHFRCAVPLERLHQFYHGKLQVRRRRHSNLVILPSDAAASANRNDQAENCPPESGQHSSRAAHTRSTITSVDLISAAARSPGFSRIS